MSNSTGSDRDPPTDEELMRAYVEGDSAAHRALFDRLSPVLTALALRHLRDRSDAEDIVQRTFLSMHRARFDFRQDAKLRPWVFTIAMNLVRDAFRSRKRRRETTLDERPGLLSVAANADRIEAAEERQRVLDALEKLAPDQRRAIELHWFEDRPFAEIAEMVGASVSAVKVRAHRGYKKMKVALTVSAANEKPPTPSGVQH